jgi:hypothetical protein
MLNRIKSLMRDEVCPYCFNTFQIKNTPFRCTSPATVCAPELDDVRSKVWRDSKPLGRVLSASKSFARSSRCPTCRHDSFKRLCPHCHMELPSTITECDNYIFALIGAKEAGKSHYLAVLIQQIRNVIGPNLQVLLEPLNDQTISRYQSEFYDPIYKRKTTIAPTQSAQANNSVQIPLLYTLTFVGKGILGGTKIKKTVTLAFFDTAGEDLNSADVMATVNKYIYRSNGIILLLDPLQLDYVRDQLSSTVSLPSQNTETVDIITRTTDLIRNGRRMDHKDMIPTPLAIAFSKFDALDSLIDPHFQIKNSANHCSGFDIADFNAVNAEMEALVARWHGEGLLNQVRTRYKNHAFFGLTALGCNPHGGSKVPRVVPRRVEDPFLWLLHRHGLIKAIK